jgi:hypothetical protein
MHLVGGIPELLAFLELLDDVRVARRSDKGWELIKARKDAVLNLTGRNMAPPTDHGRYAKTRGFLTRQFIEFAGSEFLSSRHTLSLQAMGEGVFASALSPKLPCSEPF